jgi:hypothetical protein
MTTRRCITPPLDASNHDFAALSPADQRELLKFADYLAVQADRKAGGDPAVCDLAEALIYPGDDMSLGEGGDA